MKKLLLLTMVLALNIVVKAQEDCGSILNLPQIQSTNPSRYQRILNLETHIQNYITNQSITNARLINNNGQIVIPVVVHVLHRGEAVGSGFNISDAQIQSQIDVLNEDFSFTNADKVDVPAVFQAVAGNSRISFQLACIDPNGNSTNGIIRKYTSVDGFPVTQSGNEIDEFTTGIKYSSQGGDDAWQTNKYLNLWVCDLRSGLNGYSQFPDDYPVKPNTDGVVVRAAAFGRGFAGLDPRYNLGRTVTHEVGHWLALRHPSGDVFCGDDFVADTPPEATHLFANCQIFPYNTSCNNTANGEMFMNSMNSIPHICRLMFTNGQGIRMRAVFATGGPRESFINNYFSLNSNATNQQCTRTVYANNPICLPITWSISSGSATIAPNGNSAIITPTAFGNYTVTTTSGNYTDSKTFSYYPAELGLSINQNSTICSAPKTYSINNLTTGSTVSPWTVTQNPVVVSNTTTGNNVIITPTSSTANGNIVLTATVNSHCNLPSFTISKNIHVGKYPAPTVLAMQHSAPNTPTVWFFEAPIYADPVTYNWYSVTNGGNPTLIFSGRPSPSSFELLIPCRTSIAVYCTVTNACGTSAPSAMVSTPLGYCKPTKGGISTFPIDHPIYAPKKLNVSVATTSSELFGHLFYDKESLANEMIQGVNVYTKAGELVMQTGALDTKTTQLDFTELPDGTYLIEVLGKDDFKELHTFYYSQFNQEEYILDNIANGGIVINGDRSADRLYVLQQKLFADLQCDAEAMNSSSTLQDFANHNATGSFGNIWLIQNALGRDDITGATDLLDRWETTNAIDNNFKNYYRHYIKTVSNVSLEPSETEILHTIARGCPLTDGEIVYAARDLYNYLQPYNIDDYTNACSSIGLRMSNPNRAEITNIIKANIIYPNPSKGNITIDNLDYGTKTITITNAFGQSVLQQLTNNKTLGINLNLSAGVYFVNIANAKTGKTETQKLIIE